MFMARQSLVSSFTLLLKHRFLHIETFSSNTIYYWYFQKLYVAIENGHHQAFFYKILKIKVKGFLFERSLKYYRVYKNNILHLFLRFCGTPDDSRFQRKHEAFKDNNKNAVLDWINCVDVKDH